MTIRWLLLMLFIITMPVTAQTDDTTTYEFEDTATTVTYPADWEAELVDGIYIVQNGNQSQALILDYPVVSTVSDGDPSPFVAVQELVTLLLETNITEDEIYDFVIDGRMVYAYDVEMSLSGGVYVIEFSNGTLGAIITIELDRDTETALLESFDSTGEPATDVAVPAGRSSSPRETPSVFLLNGEKRFFIPAGWVLELRERDESEYAILAVPDADVTVRMLDLSMELTKGTDLTVVVDSIAPALEADLDIGIENDADDYSLGDREALRYPVTVDSGEGYLVILRYSSDEIGAVVVSGTDTADYALQITQLIGSFNNLGAVLDYVR